MVSGGTGTGKEGGTVSGLSRGGPKETVDHLLPRRGESLSHVRNKKRLFLCFSLPGKKKGTHTLSSLSGPVRTVCVGDGVIRRRSPSKHRVRENPRYVGVRESVRSREFVRGEGGLPTPSTSGRRTSTIVRAHRTTSYRPGDPR